VLLLRPLTTLGSGFDSCWNSAGPATHTQATVHNFRPARPSRSSSWSYSHDCSMLWNLDGLQRRHGTHNETAQRSNMGMLLACSTPHCSTQAIAAWTSLYKFLLSAPSRTVVAADHDVGVVSQLGAVQVAQQPAKLRTRQSHTAAYC
jgi:hypothetical protein